MNLFWDFVNAKPYERNVFERPGRQCNWCLRAHECGGYHVSKLARMM